MKIIATFTGKSNDFCFQENQEYNLNITKRIDNTTLVKSDCGITKIYSSLYQFLLTWNNIKKND